MEGVSPVDSMKFALLAMTRIFIICSIGFVLSTKRIGILSPAGNKLLNKLVFVLFLPCLIFTELGSVITLQKMLQWWFIPVNVLLAALLGCTIGSIVVLISRPPQQFARLIVVMTGIGNIGNMPLVILSSVCHHVSNFAGDPDECNSESVAYIAFGQWVGAVIVYTFVYHMLDPAQQTAAPELEVSSMEDLLEDKEVLLEEEGCVSVNVKWWKIKAMQVKEIAKILHLSDIFQPPVIFSILALVTGATPILKSLILEDTAPLSFIAESMQILGDAMVPCILLTLGGNLKGDMRNSKLNLGTIITITFTRLFIIPPVGMGVILLADKLRFLPMNNPLFRLVLLLQHSMPSSILAGSVAAMRGAAEKETAAILFWEHIVAIFSITLWLVVYLNLLF
ncbi:hypothetical protein KP509_01G079400 [Ceratopteris richardii]|uniref:Uncharacterized protein n=1 Tax=Ceratopteris richardii TaxID=49495 RepID=A0A8T2VEH9_CERRI|nr:hypothetical protein KP509_01G079400 [Ceratopteris richardii]